MTRTAKFIVAALVLLAALLLALLVASVSTEPSSEVVVKPPAQETITAPAGGPTVTVDSDEQLEPGELGATGIDSHEDLGDEQPAGAPPNAAEQVEENTPETGPPVPVGGAQLLPCTWHPVRNFSARTASVSQVVLHFTVSAPGSLDAIWRLFDTPSFGASSHILLEPKGRCEQLVAYGSKAWTQGAFNSPSVSVEIVCCNTSVTTEWWKAQPIIKDKLLASWVVDRLRQFGLKPAHVDPVGCTPGNGWTDHNALECGNDHTDVQPNFPYGLFQRQVEALFSPTREVAAWQARAGGELLAQRTAKDGVSGYKRIVQWLQGHPGVVSKAESSSGTVALRKVLVKVPA